jgi:hypothetical protein
MASQKEQIHQAVLDAGRPLADQEIVDLLGIGGLTPANTVRRDLNETGRFQRGVDGRWAPHEWRTPIAFAPAAVEGDELDVARLVQPSLGMGTYVAHQTIRNIVASYEAATDPVAEAVQNALDAVSDDGHISVAYDPISGVLVVEDDGPGLTRDAFAQLVSPNVSTKQTGTSVGYKGVGLTFLCFSADRVEIAGDGWTATIEHARQWVDDPFGWRWPAQPQVKFAGGPRRSGIRYQTVLGPRARNHLAWITSGEQLSWLLRTHTPLGALEARKSVTVTAEVSGPVASTHPVELGPLLPTEFAAAPDLLDLTKVAGKAQPTFDSVWRNWTTEELRDALIARRKGDDGRRLAELAKRHSIRVFGYMAKSREALASLGENSGVSDLVGAHGVRVFSRNQPLSRPPQPIRLTGSTGYFNRLWIRLDVDAEADIGRKSLPAIEQELQSIASFVGAELVRTGAAWLYAEDPEHRSRGDEEARRGTTHCWDVDGQRVQYWDIRDEQDVVSLYNRFVGAGLLRHLPIVASWGSTGVYDARARHLPEAVHPAVEAASPGVRDAGDGTLRVEFKLRARDVIRDVESRKKSFENIDLLVAWELGRWPETHEWTLESAIGPAGARRYAGVTHLIRRAGSGEIVTRVICMADLLAPFECRR